MRSISAGTAALLSFCVAATAFAQENTKTFTYTKTKQAELQIIVHFPPDWKESDKRPGIVFFFGGGWENGTIRAFEPQAQYLASRGMVTARADYRVKSRHGVTPKECVDDARAALRWFRQNAGKLGVDPERIVASGGSAGGHIAACTTLMPEDELKDENVSCKANALILFNPVLRFGRQMLQRVNNDEAVGKAISPVLYLKKDSPPALLFFGTDDRLINQGNEFMERSKELGHRAELFTAEKQPHGFFNRSPWREKTLQKTDEFLASLGYLQGKPTVQVPEAKKEASQPPPPPKVQIPKPTFANVSYGPHERNILDFWQAKSEQSTPVLVSIHGGGFVAGNKGAQPQLLKDCLNSGISVAAINYRYSTQAIAPAPFEDGARAVQFIRSKAKEWNIDPTRFAATGGSAGAGISLWLGFHKDMADPKSDDPVLRQSTRLSCMVVFEGQTSYDPRFIRTLFPDKDIYKIGALATLFGVNLSKLDELAAEKYKLFEECSPITHVTKDAPPVLLVYNNPIDAEIVNQGIGIHHPLFGKVLKEKMDSLGIPCEVVAAGKRLGGGTPTKTIDFLTEHLRVKKGRTAK
ncbi:MAG TPA: alpha/beta hydrolase [Gemmataceae bacterium]|jgi:acetyl esterase/lipase